MTRLSWSRPFSSVPSQCSDDGSSRVLARSWTWGSWGVMTGAVRAVRNTIATMASPTTASLLRMNRRRRSPNWVWTRMPMTVAWVSAAPKPWAPDSRVTSPAPGGPTVGGVDSDTAYSSLIRGSRTA